MSRRHGLVAAIVLIVLACAGRVHAADALDAYRAWDRASRAQVLTAAREAIAHACVAGDTAAAGATSPDWPGAPVGVYLSLARDRATRACLGSDAPLATLDATLRELAGRIVAHDPRRPPLAREELDRWDVVVAFAAAPQPVADPMLVAPGREGLLVATPRGRIAFLPGEARTVSWALGEARRAGVLGAMAEASFFRFAVVVLRDAAPRFARARTARATDQADPE